MFEVITECTGAYEEHDLSGLGFFPDVVQFFGLDMDPRRRTRRRRRSRRREEKTTERAEPTEAGMVAVRTEELRGRRRQRRYGGHRRHELERRKQVERRLGWRPPDRNRWRCGRAERRRKRPTWAAAAGRRRRIRNTRRPRSARSRARHAAPRAVSALGRSETIPSVPGVHRARWLAGDPPDLPPATRN